jgi:hypothetical protein
VSRWVRSRGSGISQRASSMCIPAESAYCVTLSCSSRAMRCRSESSTSRCGVRVVDLAVCGGPGDEPPDDSPVEPDGDVHVPEVRLRVVRGVRRAGDDRGEVPAHEFGYGQRIGPLRPVRPAHEVAGAGLDELAVGQGEHDPVGRQVLGGRLHHRPHERLGALSGAHQRRGDPFQRRDDPAQPLGGGAVLGEVVRFARPQSGEGLQVRWTEIRGTREPFRRAPDAPRRPLRRGHRPTLTGSDFTGQPGTAPPPRPPTPTAGWWSGRRHRG